ncbi:MAG: peptidoglycan DD-metalloendopeptidase family protein [Bdellovibrionales bacterium]|nr:peptidoglycan DD-metalloendopeptidase family protein [Bdellovibrionales bacterium]
MMTSIETLLRTHQSSFHPLVPFDFNAEGVHIDLSIANEELQHIEDDDATGWERYIWTYMKQQGAAVCAGGYREVRSRYLRSVAYLENGEPRTTHMGVDIWAAAATPLFVPYPATVHSFQDNAAYLDYGPTVILQHRLEGETFHTLYGHLTRESLAKLTPGQKLEAGMTFAHLGTAEVNGNWPPHLHFQLILDMQGRTGDFPGLCTAGSLDRFAANCPDPNLILGYRSLEPND